MSGGISLACGTANAIQYMFMIGTISRLKPIGGATTVSSNIAKLGVKTAKTVGLNYVSDKSPGFRRIGTKKVFRYLDTKGRVVKSPETLRRIARLAIPP